MVVREKRTVFPDVSLIQSLFHLHDYGADTSIVLDRAGKYESAAVSVGLRESARIEMSLLSADATQTPSPSGAAVSLPQSKTSEPVGRQMSMELLSINPIKGLDYIISEPCPTCGQSPQDIICVACASSTIPHVRHGLEGTCETCEGKSLASTETIYPERPSIRSRTAQNYSLMFRTGWFSIAPATRI